MCAAYSPKVDCAACDSRKVVGQAQKCSGTAQPLLEDMSMPPRAAVLNYGVRVPRARYMSGLFSLLPVRVDERSVYTRL